MMVFKIKNKYKKKHNCQYLKVSKKLVDTRDLRRWIFVYIKYGLSILFGSYFYNMLNLI